MAAAGQGLSPPLVRIQNNPPLSPWWRVRLDVPPDVVLIIQGHKKECEKSSSDILTD
jgi:hypothetical protein